METIQQEHEMLVTLVKNYINGYRKDPKTADMVSTILDSLLDELMGAVFSNNEYVAKMSRDGLFEMLSFDEERAKALSDKIDFFRKRILHYSF